MQRRGERVGKRRIVVITAAAVAGRSARCYVALECCDLTHILPLGSGLLRLGNRSGSCSMKYLERMLAITMRWYSQLGSLVKVAAALTTIIGAGTAAFHVYSLLQDDATRREK